MKELKLKHKLFANEYIKNGQNATQAYLKAYPDASYETANVEGSRFLRNPSIRAYIDAELKKIEEKAILSRDEILKLLAKAARGEMTEEKPVFNPASGSIEKVKVEIAPRDRMKSLELAGKTMNLFTDKLDISGDIEIKVEIDD